MNEQPFAILPVHEALWQQLSLKIESNRVAQAMIFVGPRHANLSIFSDRLAAMLLCEEISKPCGQCKICRLVNTSTHPDYNLICPDTDGGIIKVEQIRSLQQNIYQTPKLGIAKVIVLSPTDKMNNASANALLKILEEPPSFVYFILLAEQTCTVPATILSRCQKYFCPGDLDYLDHYTELSAQYDCSQSRAKIHQDHLKIVTLLCDVIDGSDSPCNAAAMWSQYSLDDLLWYLYLVVSQAICSHHAPDTRKSSPSIRRLSNLLKPPKSFAILAQINTVRAMIIRSISINQTLAIESLLINAFDKDKI